MANIRWRQSVVSKTSFRDLTFVNCDFGGTTFEYCTFDGAVFVNCVLSDVNFVGCTIHSAPEWQFSNEQWAELDDKIREPLVEDPPTFTLTISEGTAQDITALLAIADSDRATTLSTTLGESLAGVVPGLESAVTDHRRPGYERPPTPRTAGGTRWAGDVRRTTQLTYLPAMRLCWGRKSCPAAHRWDIPRDLRADSRYV